MIPFLDLGRSHAPIRSLLDEAYHRVMNSGWFIMGPELEAFESEFARYCGVKHCIGLGNGLDAIRLLLLAHGIGPGDEVIVPSNTFIATWLAVTECGATPVPVEPDPLTYNLDVEHIEAAGVHSGDSMGVLPPQRLLPQVCTEIEKLSAEIAKRLDIIGHLNLQLAIKNNVVFVLEANPRSSRSVPFICKAANIPLIDLGIWAVLGKTKSEVKFSQNFSINFIFNIELISISLLNILSILIFFLETKQNIQCYLF